MGEAGRSGAPNKPPMPSQAQPMSRGKPAGAWLLILGMRGMVQATAWCFFASSALRSMSFLEACSS